MPGDSRNFDATIRPQLATFSLWSYWLRLKLAVAGSATPTFVAWLSSVGHLTTDGGLRRVQIAADFADPEQLIRTSPESSA